MIDMVKKFMRSRMTWTRSRLKLRQQDRSGSCKRDSCASQEAEERVEDGWNRHYRHSGQQVLHSGSRSKGFKCQPSDE
ncbi:hypothetical protein LX36DRAFT_426260 [Colletotrichum falcatum]|nr:hypothetical protein LX36DRAFT_426260 [Colletotrichum falcatum]